MNPFTLHSDDFIEDTVKDNSSDVKGENNTTILKEESTKNDATSDNWLEKYLTLDLSDDLYYGVFVKKYRLDENYIKNLKWNNKINFYVDKIDQNNLYQNTNISFWLPHIFMPIGGYSYNRGFDIGFLYRLNNINNSFMNFTTATSFGQNGKFWQHLNYENQNILKDKRLKLFITLSFFTTFPQYQSKLFSNSKDNPFLSIFNSIWDKLKINFTDYNETGLYFIAGGDYRIPKIDINWTTLVELMYKYDASIITKFLENSLEEKSLDNHNLSVVIREDFLWNKMRNSSTIPVGNELKASFKFYLPTGIGGLSKDFRFKSRIEERFTKILFRDFALKLRALVFANYNISEDYSGDPYIRGYFDKELVGFFGVLFNFDFYIPVMNVDITEAGGIPLLKDAKFLLYFNIFLDGGFTIENWDNILDNFLYDQNRTKEPDTFQITLGENYSFIPALTVGAGLRIYPYFLNFIIRLDFGVNLIKAIVYQKPNVEFVFSFTDIY